MIYEQVGQLFGGCALMRGRSNGGLPALADGRVLLCKTLVTKTSTMKKITWKKEFLEKDECFCTISAIAVLSDKGNFDVMSRSPNHPPPRLPLPPPLVRTYVRTHVRTCALCLAHSLLLLVALSSARYGDGAHSTFGEGDQGQRTSGSLRTLSLSLLSVSLSR